jgi:hypothetical protein
MSLISVKGVKRNCCWKRFKASENKMSILNAVNDAVRRKPMKLKMLVMVVLVGVGTLISTLSVDAQINAGGPAQTNKSAASTTISNLNADASVAAEFEQARQTFKGFRVESVEEFIKIKNYHEQMLSEGKITHTFTTPDGHLVHCIEIGSQESVKRAGIDPKTIRLAPEIPPPDSQSTHNQNMADPAAFGMDESLDPDGNMRKCPSGSIPVLIPSLEELCGFGKLEDRFRKWPVKTNAVSAAITNRIHGGVAPLGSTGNEPASVAGHEYARAQTSVVNQGAQADFNVWQPAVTGINEFSLSQLWVASGQSGEGLQTVETGWQVYPDKYLDSNPHFFIYYTTDNYNILTSYYNLDFGTAFIQTTNSVLIGGSLSSMISTTGGSQYEVTLMFYRDPGGSHNWWLKYGNTWLGYYPNSIFNSSGIANESVHIVFGGEIINNNFLGVHTTTQMGSGQFPSGGWQHAAFIKRIKYYDINDNLLDATSLFRDVSNFGYYDATVVPSSDPNWGQYIYFGGPGYVGVNDVCSGAIALSDNVYYEQNTSNAADDSGPCSGTISKGVWFTFTPSVTGTATMDTTPSDFDTKIEIFGGACGALSSITCNDNNGPAYSGIQASASFSCVAGTSYHICAGGSGGASGNLKIRAHAIVSVPPQISVSPTSGLNSSGNQGGLFSPSSQQYTISNTGGGTLNWTVSADQSWVTVSQSSGQNSGTVTVSINSNANSLSAGTHSSTVTFGGNGGSTTRQVQLTVIAPVTLSVSPSGGFNSGGNQGGPFNPSNQQYSVSNAGGGTLNWTASVNPGSNPALYNWVTVAPNGGQNSGTVTVSINANANALGGAPAGNVYPATITFSGNGGTTTRSVQLTVYPSTTPQLSVTPSSGLTSTGNQGGPFSPSSQQYTVGNTGSGTLNWTASADQTWVTVSQSSGQNSGNVTVSINSNANSLSAGTYSSTLTFGGNGGNTTRQVQLTVNNGGPQLSVTPSSGLTSSGNQGGPFSPSSQQYTVSNAGGGTLNWTASADANWVTVSQTNGQNSGTITVSINANANSSTAGTKSSTVTFGGNGGTTTRSVQLTVYPTTPQLSVTPSSGLTSSGNQGGYFSPSGQQYNVSNTGGGTLNWTASADTNWVTVSQTNGQNSGTVTVSINANANSLTAGTNSATVTFGGNGGTTTRPVQLTVYPSATPQLSVTPSSGLTSSGNQGGPFSPSSQQYTVSNTGGGTLNWTASADKNWVTVSQTNGLNSGTVTISINANANSLTVGTYFSTVTFGGNGGTITEQVQLTVAISAITISSITQITNVVFSGSSGNYTLTINGSGFGSYPGNLPFSGGSSYFRIADAAQIGFGEWGYSGDANGLTYNSWSDTQIVVSGFGGQPGDAIVLGAWNPSSGLGATWGGNVPGGGVGTPQIRSVTFSGSGQSLRIIVQGSGFGNAPVSMPFTGDLNYFIFDDARAHCGGSTLFEAGTTAWGHRPDSVTLNYESWSDTEIVINGFADSYGQGCATVQGGDPVTIEIWNTSDTDQTGPQTAWGGFVSESGPQITNVVFSGSPGSYTITVSGSGFGNLSNLPFTGTTTNLSIVDFPELGSAEWGYSGDFNTLTYQSWSDTQIQLSGFGGQPGDAITVAIWNPSTGAGATWGGNVPGGSGTPQISSVTFSGSGTNLQIYVNGSGFGSAPIDMPFTGDLNQFIFQDHFTHSPGTGSFEAGGNRWGHGTPDSVTLNYQSWSDSQIVINGFAGAYGQGNNVLQNGDPVTIVLWNSSDTDQTGPQTAWAGTCQAQSAIVGAQGINWWFGNTPSTPSLSLASGGELYVYGATTGGAYPMTAFANGQTIQITNANGNVSAELAVTANNNNSYTTGTSYDAFGGFGVSGFNFAQGFYGVNPGPGPNLQASVQFTLSAPALVVVMGMGSSQATLSFSGLNNPTIDVSEVSGIYEPALGIEHEYLQAGTYTIQETTGDGTSYYQTPQNEVDLIGILIFSTSTNVATSSYPQIPLPALQPPLPTVTTSAASGVTANSATLNGSVNPNGLSTTAYFQWGTDTNYGNTVPNPALPCGSGNTFTNLTITLTGLNPNTTYHYQLVASNASGGTVYGADQTFTTLSIPTWLGETGGQLRIIGGTGSFASVSDDNDILSVSPGSTLNGTVNLQAFVEGCDVCIVPLIYTPTWGNDSTSWQLISANIPNSGYSSQTANVSLTAPTIPGVYYIIFAASWEIGGDHVASGSNWALGYDVWNDGNDIAELNASQISTAQLNGWAFVNTLNAPDSEHASPYYITNRPIPADAITLVVGAPQVSNQGLVAFYPFNGNANDASGNGLNGTLWNSPTFVNGPFSNSEAIYLAGQGQFGTNGQYVTIPSIDLSSMSAFTISLWANIEGITSPGDGEYVLGIGDDCPDNTHVVGIEYSFNGDGTYNVGFQAGNAGFGPATSYSIQWHRYSMVYTNGVLTAYVDGQVVGISSCSIASTAGDAGMGIHWWCNNPYGVSTRFIGSLADVRIYDRALSSQEIQTLSSVTMFGTPQFSPNSGFQFALTGLTGQTYVIQTSTNLVDWTPVYTNIGSFLFSDTNSPNSSTRFYRAVMQ